MRAVPSRTWAVWLLVTHSADRCSAFEQHSMSMRQSDSSQFVYDGPLVPEYNISIPIDHFNHSDDRTYVNRYWINDTYYRSGGPVFFYDNGEIGVTNQEAAQTLAEVNRTSGVMRLAQQYHGLAIMWEHRYFGLSLPVPLNETTREPYGGFSGYQYLTLEQASEDVVFFARNFCPGNYNRDTCHKLRPSNTPWIWIGGSYPGLRGAVMRIRNPEVFYAVWSSSAPLQARLDGSLYFTPLIASLPPNCSIDVRAAVKYADEIMSGDHGEEAFEYLQRLTFVTESLEFGLTTSYNISDAAAFGNYDIGSAMAQAFFTFQNAGPMYTADIFCNYLEAYNPDGVPANNSDPYIAVLTNPDDGTISDTGVAATYNTSVALDAYFYALRRLFYEFVESQDSKNIELPNNIIADLAGWAYLCYTMIGWIQASNPDNITVISKYYNISAEYAARLERTFYDIDAADFNGGPNVSLLNQYGGWNANPSNVMFTVGEFDPWRGGSPLSEEAEVGAPIRTPVQDVPTCNQPPNGTDVFGIILPGAAHIADLYNTADGTAEDGTRSLALALPLFQKALDAWLPCFRPVCDWQNIE